RMLSPRHHGNGLVDIFANRRSGADFNTLWSRLLAADAFAAFRELGAFDSQLAESLRIEIFSRGNARSPEVSWRNLRGRAPPAECLVEEVGLSLPEQGDQSEPARSSFAITPAPPDSQPGSLAASSCPLVRSSITPCMLPQVLLRTLILWPRSSSCPITSSLSASGSAEISSGRY